MRYIRSVAPRCGVARKHVIFRARNIAALAIFTAVPRNLHHLLGSPQHLLSLVEHSPGLVVERANSPHERFLHLLRHPVQFHSQLLNLGLVSSVPRIALWGIRNEDRKFYKRNNFTLLQSNSILRNYIIIENLELALVVFSYKARSGTCFFFALRAAVCWCLL